MVGLVTTRFNSKTWACNIEYRNKYDFLGCLYCEQQPMTKALDSGCAIFVIEMNNTLNRIEGIGLIKNIIQTEKYYKVYDDCNYNRYTYKGKFRINREVLIEHNKKLVEALDYILFKEKTHMKRGSGFTQIPYKLLKHKKCEDLNLKEEIKYLYVLLFLR